MADPGASQPSSDKSEPESLRGLRRAVWAMLRLLPKNAMSRLMGRFASLELPKALQRAEIRLVARLAGVDLTEARDDVGEFASLQQFFTRALRPGLRTIEGGEEVLVSPCDGAWGEAGRIEQGKLLQIKGRPYRVSELLGDEVLAGSYEGGCYATFYLSPRDYHRFHTPTAGRITRIDYHPGSLWPVNSTGLRGVEALFVQNERICAFLQPAVASAFEPLALIAVGATMVGSVRLAFDDLCTNVPGAAPVRRVLAPRAPSFGRGDEWGHFEFGSTIVLLTPREIAEIEPRPSGTRLRLGEAIGRLLVAGS